MTSYVGERGPVTIFTIGHSTRSLEQFLELLRGHDVAQLVDVRSIPRSRTNPQFNQSTLPAWLASQGIAYHHLPSLGGRRRARPDSPNRGWRNPSFRGYADHMQTPAFAEALHALVEIGTAGPTAIMCAEAVPWRCHRSLIADALLVRGITACEIVSATTTRPHALTSFAQVRGTTITYPGLDIP